MGIGTILTIIYYAIKYGPVIFGLVKELIDLIGKLKDKPEQTAWRNDLEAAVEHYGRYKDSRPLYHLRERLQRRCLGDFCPLPSSVA
jgi:hypothetical protein